MKTGDYLAIRSVTEQLAAPLSPEDQVVQSMPDVSPTKWHRAHVTWFFETFLLSKHAPRYQLFDPDFPYLFNSYYEALGPRQPRPERGLITRPSLDDIVTYRSHVDDAIATMVDGGLPDELNPLIELGCQHEQQHQELLVMDIKHVLSRNPLRPRYGSLPWHDGGTGQPGWHAHAGGEVTVGHGGDGFAFDNEHPRHPVLLRPFLISTELVNCGDWLAFVDDGGYQRPELWMSDGWSCARTHQWQAPLYWQHVDGGWRTFTLDGLTDIDPAAAIEHVSWYEADAYARWRGKRLPTEQEWEAAAPDPRDPHASDWYRSVWQWTASPYVGYPGYRPPDGAIGEYNGKFMVNQQVLRGGSWFTPPGHARRTYRNFFPPHARWALSGLRLAADQ